MIAAELVPTEWDTFTVSLAESLKALPFDAVLRLELHDDAGLSAVSRIERPHEVGASRYVQFTFFSDIDEDEIESHADVMLRAEVVSNAYLKPSLQHMPVDHRQLHDIGWCHPTEESPNHFVDACIIWVDLVADMVVDVLRDVWNIVDVGEVHVVDSHDVWEWVVPTAELL